MAGYWREYVDWGRHDLLVPPRLICSPRPPGRRWAERVFMYLPGIVSDRSWRQGRIPILYALPVWSAKQPANWPGTSASIRYAVYNACLAMRLRYRIAGSSSLMRRTIWSVEQLMRCSKIWKSHRRERCFVWSAMHLADCFPPFVPDVGCCGFHRCAMMKWQRSEERS